MNKIKHLSFRTTEENFFYLKLIAKADDRTPSYALNKIIDSGKTAGTMCNLSNTNKFSKMGVKFFFAGTGEWMANGAKQFVDAGES